MRSQDDKTSGKSDMVSLKILQECLVFTKKRTLVFRRLSDHYIAVFVGRQSVGFQLCILRPKYLNN